MGPHPQEFIGFGSDVFAAMKDVRGANKAAGQEIRQLEREVQKLAKLGQKIDKTTIGRLEELQQKKKTYEQVLQTQERIKQNAKDVKFLKALSHIQAVQRLAQGKFDIGTLSAVVSNPDFLEKVSKGLAKGGDLLKRVGLTRAGGAMQGIGGAIGVAGPYGMIAATVAEAAIGRVEKYFKRQEAAASAEGTARDVTRAGEIDPQLARAYEKLIEMQILKGLEDEGKFATADMPAVQKAIFEALTKNMKDLAKRSKFLESLTDDEVNQILGTDEIGQRDKTIEQRRRLIQLKIFERAGTGAGYASIDKAMAERQEEARRQKEEFEKLNPTQHFYIKEQQKLGEILFGMRRNFEAGFTGGKVPEYFKY